ncbi:MAG: transporter ATP-binding protein [Blastococcus sp.]|nr:transporter ATP-binding protein [Blastococcus sp.]
MAELRVNNLYLDYGTGATANAILKGVSMELQRGEVVALLGPSGSGKTTLLRAVAGLESPKSGTITIGERSVFDGERKFEMPAEQRSLGLVFQSYALWPHKTVADNVGYGLKLRKVPGDEIAKRVKEVLGQLGLGHLGERFPHQLSGGQQQRVAIARALVYNPPVILLDEPLSNLDAKLRESLRFELKRLQRELGITSIYVTHDQVEALSLSSQIAVMREGEVVQLGKPRDIYTNPKSRFVAEFIGTSNFLNGRVSATDGDRVTVDTTEGRLVVRSSAGVPVGSEAIVSARPEVVEISTSSADGAVPNEWSGEIVTRMFLGDAVDHVVKVGGFEVRNRSNPNQSIEPGTRVYLRMNPELLTLVPVG